MSVTNALNIALNLSALIITVFTFIGIILSGGRKEPIFRWFFYMVLFSLLGMVAEASIGFFGEVGGTFVHVICCILDYLSYVFTGVWFFAFGAYIYEYFKARINLSKKFFYLIVVFAAIDILLSTINQFNGMYGRLDESNHYIQGDLFWLSHVFSLLSVLAIAVVALRYAKNLKTKEWLPLSLYPILPLVLYSVETYFKDLWIAHFGAAIFMLLIYITLHAELREQAQRQKTELEKARISLMLSQIQPHFLYNSLSAISSLCTDNPKAKKALITFSEYLRGNMDSLTQKSLIPFDKELEHTKQYLFLEELRFEERLRVVYEIKTEDFMIPALTLQPIVENAVRYGIMQKRSGGTVAITVEEKEKAFFITVCDDGAGFDPLTPLSSDRSHTGIDGVKQRLNAMCGGRLTIESVPESGTTAIIEIPKGGEKA